MRSFLFEKELITEVVVRWVGEHQNEPACRKVLDTHLKAQKTGLQIDAELYRMALKALWSIRPWDNEKTGLIIKPKAMVLV